MKRILVFLLLLTAFIANAQEALNLENCYRLATIHYPVARQQALLDQQMAIDLSAISSEKLPQFDLSTQATYQSDVTEVPIPNAGIEPLNND